MKFNLLINQLDEHNEVGLLLAQKYKVKSVVMLYKNKEKKNSLPCVILPILIYHGGKTKDKSNTCK